MSNARNRIRAWERTAEMAQNAAKVLGAAHPRGAVNRIYYAAFSIVHARLCKEGLTPRTDEQTWSHAELPRMFDRYLSPAHDKRARGALQRLYSIRCQADYEPTVELSTATVANAFRDLKRVERAIA